MIFSSTALYYGGNYIGLGIGQPVMNSSIVLVYFGHVCHGHKSVKYWRKLRLVMNHIFLTTRPTCYASDTLHRTCTQAALANTRTYQLMTAMYTEVTGIKWRLPTRAEYQHNNSNFKYRCVHDTKYRKHYITLAVRFFRFSYAAFNVWKSFTSILLLGFWAYMVGKHYKLLRKIQLCKDLLQLQYRWTHNQTLEKLDPTPLRQVSIWGLTTCTKAI